MAIGILFVCTGNICRSPMAAGVFRTLARRAESAGYEVYCVTPDKDFFQLVSDRIFIYRPSKPGIPEEIIDATGVHRKFGVTPDRVIDVLALIGDTSDNVPGVKGIGEKTAIPLIQEYGTIEELYERIDEIPKAGVKKKLLENQKKEKARMRENGDVSIPQEAFIAALRMVEE